MADTEASGIQPPANLHFDDLNKLRVMTSDACEETVALKDECKDFVEKFEGYQELIDTFTGLMSELGKEVEAEKMKAIGSQNLLKTVRKQRDTKQQQLKEMMVEKNLQLMRLRAEVEQLQRHEDEQREFVAHFANSK